MGDGARSGNRALCRGGRQAERRTAIGGGDGGGGRGGDAVVARCGAAVARGRVDGPRRDRDPGAGRVEAVGCGCECGERARGYRGRRGWARVGFRVEVVGAAEGGG